MQSRHVFLLSLSRSFFFLFISGAVTGAVVAFFFCLVAVPSNIQKREQERNSLLFSYFEGAQEEMRAP